MSKFKIGLITFGVAFVLGSIYVIGGLTHVGMGSVGIVKHMDGSITQIRNGWSWTGWGTSTQEYETYTQSLKKSWSVGTGDQQELPVKTNLTWEISTKDKDVETVYLSVGGKEIEYLRDNIVNTTMQNVANRITHKYSWNDIKGAKQGSISDEIEAELKHDLALQGIIVKSFGFSHVGSPQGMQQSQQQLASSELNIKQAEAMQQKAKIDNETKILNAQAQAQADLIQAQGKAKANAVLKQSLTPQIVELEKIKKWNGVNSTTVVGGNSSTMVNVK
jgi:regulator of protease activity HflC (stomatin/prohibitin superfamily)